MQVFEQVARDSFDLVEASVLRLIELVLKDALAAVLDTLVDQCHCLLLLQFLLLRFGLDRTLVDNLVQGQKFLLREAQ